MDVRGVRGFKVDCSATERLPPSRPKSPLPAIRQVAISIRKVSPMRMSEEELAEIERRCEVSTPGPWQSWIEGRDHAAGDSVITTGRGDIYLSGATSQDQDFIAAARQDVPRLIAEIRRLTSRDGG